MDSRRGDELGNSEGANRILLVLADDRDRTLLEEWLSGFPGYDVTVASRPEEVPGTFDLCLCDERAVRRFVPVLEARQRAADPVFLPYVLLVTGEESSPPEVRKALVEETDLDVQELVTLPVDQPEFKRRLDNLLRARESSTQLAERTHQYRELVRLAPESILLVRGGQIVYANESAAALFGYENSAAVVDTPLSEHVNESDDAIWGALDTIEARGSTDSYVDARMTASDGGVRDVEVAGVTIQFGGEPTTQLILRDVTDQREREQQLTLFERAIETAAQGVTIADAGQEDMPLIYVNEAFERITGYDAPECLGENCRFLQGEGTDQGTVATIREALEAESPVSVEILNYRKDGTPFWNELDIVPVRDDSGAVTHYLGLQQDITDRIEREQRLSVLDRVLRHNVRNRGNVIQAHADRIRRGVSESPAEDAERIVDSMEDLLAISDQVRTFRSVIGEESGELTEHDLAALVERVIDGLSVESPETQVTLDCPGTAAVVAHPMLPFGVGTLVRRLTDDGISPLTIRVRPGDDAVRVEFHLTEGTLSQIELNVVRGVRETSVEHAQGIEMWLIRWIVTASGGDLFLQDGGAELVLCMRLQSAG